DLAPDVRSDLAAQVSLDLDVGLEVVADGGGGGGGWVGDGVFRADAGRSQRLGGAGAAHSEDVREGDLDALVARQVDSDESCHMWVFSRFGLSGGLGQSPFRSAAPTWRGVRRE